MYLGAKPKAKPASSMNSYYLPIRYKKDLKKKKKIECLHVYYSEKLIKYTVDRKIGPCQAELFENIFIFPPVT